MNEKRKLNSNATTNINLNASDKCENQNDHESQTNKSVSFNTKTSSLMDVTNDLTRSSSSSMQTLRRILEIEECRRFSEILDSKMEKLFL